MNKVKKIVIGGTASVILGLSGYVNSDKINKAVKCTARPIQWEVRWEERGIQKENYYCATNEQLKTDKDDLLARLLANKLRGESDIALAQIFIKNSSSIRRDLKIAFASKYDPLNKEFDGADFDNDILGQALLLNEILIEECKDGCSLTGGKISEKIYNIISNG